MIVFDVIKVFLPTAICFTIGICITPIITHYLYTYKAWKKVLGKTSLDGNDATEFNKIHKENEGRTPRMGGIVIWGSVGITIMGIWILARIIPLDTIKEFDFLSRSQTWIPFATLIVGSLVGLLNDFYDINHIGRGLRLRTRLGFVCILALLISVWFYTKLDVTAINIPYDGVLPLGILIVPFFTLVILAVYASGVIDGIDGLSGGVFATIFSAYAFVAVYQNQLDLAAFCATVTGGILAFLWFNIPPARFWMTETGTMGLTLTLAVVAILSDNISGGHGIALLPVIGFPLVVTVLSNIIQITSKKIFGKKVFKVAPLHHHFEALGWPGYKVTMRYWVISVICAIIGIMIAVTA